MIWGVSFGSHNSAISVFENNELVFATDGERFSKTKNDEKLEFSRSSKINFEAIFYPFFLRFNFNSILDVTWMHAPVLVNLKL